MVQYRQSIFNNINHCSNHRFIQIKIWVCIFSQSILLKKNARKRTCKKYHFNSEVKSSTLKSMMSDAGLPSLSTPQ